MTIGRFGRGGAGRGARRAIPVLAALCIGLTAAVCPAVGAHLVIQKQASGFSLQLEDMTAADAVRELGKRFGFRVVDRAPQGPRLTRSLRAPTLVGLVGQLFPAGSYAVVYRSASSRAGEAIDTILLMSATARASSPEGPRPPVDTAVRTSVDPTPPEPVDRWRPEAMRDPVAPSPATRPVEPLAAAVNPPARTRAVRPASPPSGVAAVQSPAPAVTPPALGGASGDSGVVPESVRRFISDRIDVLVDATRDATLGRPRTR